MTQRRLTPTQMNVIGEIVGSGGALGLQDGCQGAERLRFMGQRLSDAVQILLVFSGDIAESDGLIIGLQHADPCHDVAAADDDFTNPL